jgi:predicted nucleic acid-binding protein
MMTASQKQQIEKQTGKKPEQLTEDQLNDAMEKNNIEVGSSDKQLDELEKLGQLKESGVLTDQEFEAKKAQILKS